MIAALRQRIASFRFDEGAILVQVPQVPPSLVESKIVRNKGYFAYPPQGVFYLSAIFRELGVPTLLVDLNFEILSYARVDDSDLEGAWKRALRKSMESIDQPFICVSFMFDSTREQVESVVRFAREIRPDSCIAVGGVAASASPQALLDTGNVDLVFLNEGETSLKNFYGFLGGREDVEPVNIAFYDADGQFQQTTIVTGGEVDMDIREEYSKLPIGDYQKVGSLNNFSRMRGVDVPYATIISRRGCRARCTFCAVRSFNGASVRVRSNNGVIDEMVHLYENHGIRHFDWLDDDLLYDRDGAERMFRQIAERLPNITWAANNGLIAASVTDALLEAMQASNCIGFTVGLETGNREMLRHVRKPATLETFFRFAEKSRAYPKMFYLVNFILGLPAETFDQMLDSFSVAVRARLDWNNFFTFQPLKKTDAFVAYGGMDSGDEVKRLGTTVNFNPVRAGAFKTGGLITDDVMTGYDVFDLSPSTVPNVEQRREIWFTFNYIANFIRNPALTSDETIRVENSIRWLNALGTAYNDNAAIFCVLSYLAGRLDGNRLEQEKFRKQAQDLLDSPYWRARDRQFDFSALLDNQIPPLDARANPYFTERA